MKTRDDVVSMGKLADLERLLDWNMLKKLEIRRNRDHAYLHYSIEI